MLNQDKVTFCADNCIKTDKNSQIDEGGRNSSEMWNNVGDE